ncbi:glycosyltransferase family 2 protein [Microcoleus sp. FACHB-1515]|nr:glycosyltransferase family 2 protein [Microcoleus sp. FACHB-1515]
MLDQAFPDNMPLVSVIIPAYNAAGLIERTLNSVLNQTYPHLEVLVVDDGSTDQTAAIVEAITRCDSRVILLRQTNSGVAAARNLGIGQAKGEFISPLDADDLWYPTQLQRQIDCFLSSSTSVGVVYSWSTDIDADDCPTGGFHAATIEGDVYATLLCHNFLGNASCTMIRRSTLLSVGGYNSEFRLQQAQGCEDWDLYLRLAACCEFLAVPEFLVGYRRIEQSMSRDYQTMARSQALMLENVRVQRPAIPEFLHRLSRSSFYLYLARQCSLSGDDRNTLFWLGETLAAEAITPLLRPGFYRLAIESWWRLKRPAVKRSEAADSTHPAIAPPPLKVFLKLQVGNSLHQLLRWVAPSRSQKTSAIALSGDYFVDQR